MSIVALARRVIFQAMLDAIDPGAKKWRMDALRFFSDGRLEFWAEIGELSPEMVRKMVYDLLQMGGSARERRAGQGVEGEAGERADRLGRGVIETEVIADNSQLC